MKNVDLRKKNLREDYDDKLTYNYLICDSIDHGEHVLVAEFLEKVPNTEKRGDFDLYGLIIINM